MAADRYWPLLLFFCRLSGDKYCLYEAEVVEYDRQDLRLPYLRVLYRLA